MGAYTLNRFGYWFGFVALSVAVYDRTHSALAVSAMLVAGQILPAFAVPVIVARVEASRRRGELSGLYLFEALATLSLGFLVTHFWLPAVVLVAALDGTAALAASALLRSETARAAGEDAVAGRELVEAEREEVVETAQRKANAALNMVFSIVFMAGPALAGLVVAATGATTALFADAALYAACGALLLDLRPHVEEAGGDGVRERLRSAWEFIRDVRVLRTLLLAQGAALIFFASGSPIEVVYAKATLGAGDRGLGFLLAVWGAGAVLGSVIFARSVRRPVGWMLTFGTLAVGLAYIGFGLAPNLPVACIAALVGGVGNGVQWASLISAVQQLAPGRLHGRLMGAVESLGALCPAIGLALGGVLVAADGVRTAFLIVGTGAVACTAVFMRLAIAGIEPVEETAAPAGDLRRSEGQAPEPADADPRPADGPPAAPQAGGTEGEGGQGRVRSRITGPDDGIAADLPIESEAPSRAG